MWLFGNWLVGQKNSATKDPVAAFLKCKTASPTFVFHCYYKNQCILNSSKQYKHTTPHCMAQNFTWAYLTLEVETMFSSGEETASTCHWWCLNQVACLTLYSHFHPTQPQQLKAACTAWIFKPLSSWSLPRLTASIPAFTSNYFSSSPVCENLASV